MKPLDLIILLLTIFLSACQDKQKEIITLLVKEWQGKQILFPENMVFTRFASDTTNFVIPTSDYKVLVFVDSIGCTSCKLQLSRWKEFIRYTDSISQKNIPFLFFFSVWWSVGDTFFINKREFWQADLLGSIRQSKSAQSFSKRYSVSSIFIRQE